MSAATAPALAPDLEAGLRRLKLARIRRMAAEVCQTAKTQGWTPEEFLRALVEAEIAARDASNLKSRLKQAGFPVPKTLEQFQVGLSWVPQQTFDYLASLEWLRERPRTPPARRTDKVPPRRRQRTPTAVRLVKSAAISDSHAKATTTESRVAPPRSLPLSRRSRFLGAPAARPSLTGRGPWAKVRSTGDRRLNGGSSGTVRWDGGGRE